MNDMATVKSMDISAEKNFWLALPHPIMAMAPMANVTDEAFRRMFVECGKPDVFWTEFVSVEGLLSKGRERLLPDLWFSQDERPIIAQIFGGKPEQFEEVGPFIKKLGFDGVDINMGCPDRGVEKSGGGAALIKDATRARAIIRALKRGLNGKAAATLPVSVKTRLGYSKTTEFETWLAALLDEQPAALTVHLRTRAEMSDVPAHWELAPQIVTLRDKISPQTVLLGNGDVQSLADAREKTKKTGMDGVMVGAGIFGNPWFFSDRTPNTKERLERLVIHTELFEELYRSDSPRSISQGGRLKNFDVMKKHYKSYTPGEKELRVQLMESKNAAEVRKIVQDFLKKS